MLRNFSILSAGIFINACVISLPLLFINDIEHFFSLPKVWLFYFLTALFCVCEASISLNIKSPPTHQVKKSFLPYLIGLTMIFINWVVIFGISQHSSSSIYQDILISLMYISGIFIRYISISKLQHLFLNHIGLIKHHKLITDGIYSIIRHPSELGALIIFNAASLISFNLFALLLSNFVLLIMVYFRIREEDKLLNSAFNDDFIQYKQSTPALIPFLILKK
ncbi:MAG: isoprenylcysteine carboxylmethyltransferase family protein [Saccharospirillaceae bacterium]|nr:isoprenylcysteine carboxylmethyltransferase family protein [Pseudomonadales bacterium]NRB81612.1 isoprenylcysteine carboxylmethyltransferase family protein [Saccharospirillaceae bacterium]